jgi:DNA-binding NarL/FixJ family response regulator
VLVVDDNLDSALMLTALLRDMRVYALTGSSRDEDRERALAAGCDSFLVEPADPDFIDSLLGAGRIGVR